jgi:thioredoxin reductase (NADPH)
MIGNSTFYTSKPKEGMPWDVAIIGSGPASMTASIYTTRGAASTIVFAGDVWGGQLMLTTTVDNFPGFSEGVQGPELMQLMRKQSERFGSEFIDRNVDEVDLKKDPKRIVAAAKDYYAKTVIVATGADTKWLGVPGEDKLRGRGVSSCAPCDAPFFKDKIVAVVGGGDAAMEEALVLTKYAKEVVIIHRRDEFRASAAMQEEVFKKEKEEKIKIVWNSEITEFIGDQKLDKVKLKNIKTGKPSEMSLDGVFVAIGHIPATGIFKSKVDLDEKGYVKPVSKPGYTSSTNIDGVFVAGDVHDYTYRQAITAAGFGCMAGMDALKFLDKSGPSW